MAKVFDVNTMSEGELEFLSHRSQYYDMLIDRDEVDKFLHLKYLHLPKDEDDPDNGNKISSRGRLDCLKNEIFLIIFEHLDIASLFTMRMTCHSLRDLVNSWPLLHEVFAIRGKIVLKALLAVQTAKYWTMRDLKNALSGRYCAFCGSYGDILHLMSIERCCFRCLCIDRRTLVVSESYAVRCMGVPVEKLSYFPSVKPISQQSFWVNASPMSTNFGRLFDYQQAADHAMRIRALIDFKYSEPIADYRTGSALYPPTIPRDESKRNFALEDHATAAYFRSGFEACPPVIVKETIGDVDPAFLCRLDPVQAKRKYERLPLYIRRGRDNFRNLAERIPRLQRGQWKINRLYLPPFLLNPPHSSNLQHAVSIYSPPQEEYEVPILDKNNVITQGIKKSKIVQARHCTGCSYFWNFHSRLPPQAQNKYTYSANIIDDPNISDINDLKCHLRCCYLASMYWDKIWCLPRTPFSSQAQAIQHALQQTARVTAFLSHAQNRSQRRWYRHDEIDDLMVERSLFEKTPWFNRALAGAVAKQEHEKSQKQQSQLQLELQSDYKNQESSANEDRSKIDLWTGEILEEHRWDKVEDRVFQILTNFTAETVTQAAWATAHPNSGSYLFGAWKREVQERMRVLRSREIGKQEQLPEDEETAMAWFGWF